MLALIVQRLSQAVLVLVVVAFIAFLMFRFVGDPIESILGVEATLADRAALAERLGYNDPLPVQFFDFLSRVVRGDFGTSHRLSQPVGELILERLPATLELALVSALFAVVFGIILGIFAAVRRGFAANLVMAVSLIGVSLPTFLIGVLLIWIFAVLLGWLPSFGRSGTVDTGLWRTGLISIDGWRSLVLPAVTLGLYQMTLIMRLVRAEMIQVLATDYIKFARARGLPERRIFFAHALKNTLLPVITIAGLQLGSIIAFAIITESVFQWPGVGLLFINSVAFPDVPVMAAYLLLVALVFVFINLFVDLSYYLIDPRLRDLPRR
jgi:ABC-type dipeptide/oligopeptide/nickel transport system permease component